MANVQFEDPYAGVPKRSIEEPKGLSGLIIRLGLARTDAQANIVMIIIMLTSFVLAFVIYPRDPQVDLENYIDPLSDEYQAIN